jgi:hypothetical protein
MGTRGVSFLSAGTFLDPGTGEQLERLRMGGG